MPITQDRMLDLISAAADFNGAYLGLRSTLEKVMGNHFSGTAPLPQSAFDLLRSAYVQSIHQEQSAITLAVEQKHFRLTAARNDRSRRQMARHRERNKAFFSGVTQDPDTIVRAATAEEVRAHMAAQQQPPRYLPNAQPIPTTPSGQGLQLVQTIGAEGRIVSLPFDSIPRRGLAAAQGQTAADGTITITQADGTVSEITPDNRPPLDPEDL